MDARAGKFWVELKNEGKAGAAFQIRNHLLPLEAPRRYAVAAGDTLGDFWLISDNKSDKRIDNEGRKEPDYDLTLHGPNGFYSQFRGVALGSLGPEVAARYEGGDVILKLTNTGMKACTFAVRNAYGNASRSVVVQAQESKEERFASDAEHRWFDLSVTMAEEPAFLRRFAGHVETGQPSTSDPGRFLEA